MERTVEIIKNRFFEIFADSVLLYELSHSESQDQTKAALAKSCILSVNYALEAVANSFLSSIEVSSKLKGQIDRFSTLDKFDFVLQWHKSKPLPRGDKKTQIIQELINKRNDAVHPKLKTTTEEIVTTKGAGELGYVHQPKSCKGESRSKLSKIALEPEQYTDEDALIALKALVNFLNIYITNWWGIDLDISASMLMPTWNGAAWVSSEMYEKKALEVVVKYDRILGVEFIGLHGILEQFE